MTARALRSCPVKAAAAAALSMLLMAASAASAQAAEPWWRLESRPAPSNLPLKGEQLIILTATNIGNKPTSGEITLTDKIPAGLTVTYVRGNSWLQPQTGTHEVMKCSTPEEATKTGKVTCTYNKKPSEPPEDPGENPLHEFESLEISIKVKVGEAITSETKLSDNEATVEGGGAPGPASAHSPTNVSNAPASFGIEKWELLPESEGGGPDKQAGSHPFQQLNVLNFNQTIEQKPTELRGFVPSVPSLLKDVQVKLPPGLVGNVTKGALPQCSDFQFFTELHSGGNLCPANAAIGVAEVSVNEPNSFGYKNQPTPVFNLEPAAGEPARFGFFLLHTPVTFDTSVQTGGDYSVLVSVKAASQIAQVLGSQITFWGNPGDPSHDGARGWACLARGIPGGPEAGKCPSEKEQAEGGLATKAFLSLPTSCPPPGSPSLQSTALVDSWVEPGPRRPDGSAEENDPRWKKAPPSELPGLEHCDALPFSPTLEVKPDTEAGNTPTGPTIVVHVPQDSTLSETGLSASAVRSTTVTLPPGMLLSPSAGNGLEACAEGETEFVDAKTHGGVGYLGMHEFEAGIPMTTFTPLLPPPTELAPGVNFCPDGSKVGTVRIKSPDLEHEIEGGVYLAAQNRNPFGSLFAMYIVAEDPVSHVLVKLAGEVSPNPSTGQVTSTFNNTPDVPVETITLTLFGGPRASLTTPPRCGTYTTTSSLTPWTGTAAQSPSGDFNITSGAEGTGCATPRPAAAGFNAGSTSVQAGGYTGFEVNLARPDAGQAATALTMKLPTGLAAIIKNVTLCPEAPANEGTCGPGSLIGHVTASAGLGSDPFTAPTGQVFITGPYHGAPFGLSVVIAAEAGPFKFGNVVTRSTLNVDPYTAAVTIGSPIPTMVNTTTTQSGVPTQLKQLHVTVDRPNFQFNPTNCNPLKIEGALAGDEGGSAPISSRFQVGNCTMPFKPVFIAESEAKTSKNEGAALVVKVESSGLGVENIAKTKVSLPIALPSRLTTIQKACLAKVFEANPESGCPEGSNIGTAMIETPVFAHPLKGPAFLVSHGNEAFPDVEFVLKGEGVTVILDGKTDIKNGITTSSFESLPDAPFTKFLTVLPRGPHSALTANGDLCTQQLFMPTTITAQNGTVVKQETKIKVNGCSGVAGSRVESKLAKALKKCRKQFKHNRRKRVACERAAKKKYAKKHKKH